MPETYTCKGCKSTNVINSKTYFGPDRSPYCSMQCCHGHNHVERSECECSVCNNKVKIINYKIVEMKREFGEVYCSPECKKNREKPRQLTCTHCGNKKLVSCYRWKNTDKKEYLCQECFKGSIRSIRNSKPVEKKVVQVKSKTFYCSGCSEPVILTGDKLSLVERELKINPNRRVCCNKPECKSKVMYVIAHTKDASKTCYCGRKHVRSDGFCSTTCKELDLFRKVC